jgi:hypothetical protein
MYYYSSASQQNTNGTANTDLALGDLKTASATAGLRAYIRKLIAGTYTTPADNQVRLRLQRINSVGTYASGSALTPLPLVPDAPAAASLASTLPTIGTATYLAVPSVQLAYNQRGTAMWAAFDADEGVGLVGSNAAANGIAVLNSQATAASVPVTYEMIHGE